GDPDGKGFGTYGCKILQLEPNRLVAFEWTFPPFGPELNTEPFPTWVEVRLEPVAGHADQTVVHFQHLGFPHSPKWDACFALFRDKNWPAVLSMLQEYCRTQAHPAAR
ncbi:MAG TPA: SRPBCC domain-containing protein, partial [Thermoanaerobaculia bacterium]|nr:SRPBCC domain-containing protein [Thermoanaerobaculia bacterium]